MYILFIFPIRLQGKPKGKRIRQRCADILRAILIHPPSLLRSSSPSKPYNSHPFLLAPPCNSRNVTRTLSKTLSKLFLLRRGLFPTVPMQHDDAFLFLSARRGFLLLPPSLLLGLWFVLVVLVGQFKAGRRAKGFAGRVGADGLSLVALVA